MALTAGTRLGPYDILSTIGAGAMGVVYKARDTRLGRDVAIKVLPAVFARDPDRLARFEREARAVAAINHPNILSVHDIGSADAVDAEEGAARVTYMVTELLDGDTLRARLAQGPLAARKSADVGMQIARGLAAAHDRGIVHRDLKPENIVLLRDGHVKILDFGLAKQSAVSSGSGEQETIAATDAGTVLGTVGYMAPEQVRGEGADARTDLFALGAVLYELASGRRAFAAATAAETMTAILRQDPPDLSEPPSALPAAFSRVVRHALEKDPGDRFQSARDFAFALQALGDSATSSSASASTAAKTAAVRRPLRARELAAWSLAGLLALVAGAAILWPPAAVSQSHSSSASPVIFSATLAWRDTNLLSPAVSPDGGRVAFIARGPAGDSIAVRRLDSLETQPLKGTTGVRMGCVFWSPDGNSLGFIAGGKLKSIELTTEKVDVIADAPNGFGGAWGSDGTILFSPDQRSPVYRVSASGGESKPVTTLDAAAGEQAHRWPQFLPDGRHFVFMPWSSGAVTRKTQLASLDGGPSKTLFEAESAAVVAGSYYLFVRDRPSALMAQAFNPRTFEPEGRPSRVVADENVDFMWINGAPWLSGSANTLVYTTGKFRETQLTWFNRSGRALGTIGSPDVYYDPAISDDGTTLAIEKRDADRGSTDLWTVDLVRGAFSPLTTTPGFESVSTWSPDGRRVAFASDQDKAQPKIWVKDAGGTGAEDALVDGRSFPTDWSRDGKYILYMLESGATGWDVWVYDVEHRTSKALLASAFNEYGARFSNDGRWIAYVSDEGRTFQVFARSFPDGATKVQVSTEGGVQPEWRADGTEIFFLALDSTLMAADVRPKGKELAIGAAQPLFLTNAEPNRVFRSQYAAGADGQRFLVMSPLVPPSASRLVGVLNWAAKLAKNP